MDQQSVAPIENFIFNGIVNRLHQTFGCYVQFTNAENRMQEMLKIRKERNIRFPYIFVSLSDVSFVESYYNSNYLARQGMTVRLADSGNALARVKLLPCTFSMRVEYFTDHRDGDEGSVLWFIKRWMFARRLGYLKFNVKYGRTYSCPVMLDDSLSHPMKTAETEGVGCYTVEGSLTIHGFVSESKLLTSGVTTDLVTNIAGETKSFKNSNISVWSRNDSKSS